MKNNNNVHIADAKNVENFIRIPEGRNIMSDKFRICIGDDNIDVARELASCLLLNIA